MLIATEASKRGFPEFLVTVDKKYQLEWFHRLIAWKLEEVYERLMRGESPRVMIFMPPRHGKSEMATKKFPAWVLGKSPDLPIVVSSYSQELATDFGQGTRDIMNSPEYQAIFKTRLREDTAAKAKWMTEEKGGYTAVGVGGTLTGKGFKLGLVDDPHKNRKEADSPVERENVWKWWQSTFYTRQEGNAAIVVILTRWHDDDLAGRLLAEQKKAETDGLGNHDKWEILCFKALAEQDSKYRRNGEPLWPAKFSLDALEKIKHAIGSYEWSSLYQQNPVDEATQEFKRGWFRYRDLTELVNVPTRKFLTIDTAYSQKTSADFCGLVRNYVDTAGRWNLRAERRRLTPTQLIDLIFNWHREDRFEKIGIEKTAYLEGLKPFMEEQMRLRGVFLPIVELEHKETAKETRIRGLIPRYEYGGVNHLTDGGKNLCLDLEEELIRFPKSAKDDVSDSTAYQDQVAEQPFHDQGGEDLAIYF